ncbi:MAG: YCF48-related protein [Cyanobacteria bacterium P01_G01_bin.19]
MSIKTPLKVAVLGLLLAWAFFTVDVKAALAHYPHDDIFALEVSPDYQQDKTLFINVRGNIFKSEDEGASWHRIVKGLDHQYQLAALDISARSPEVLYLSSLGDGVYKSSDRGDSWDRVNRGLENLNIDLVEIASDTPDLVLAAGAETGLYKTENGGQSWSTVFKGRKITAIAFDEARPGQILVGDRQGNLFLSGDRGTSWQSIASLKNSGAIQALAIFSNSAQDRTIWVGTEKEGVLKTVDDGAAWVEANRGIEERSITSLAISSDYRNDGTLLASTWNRGVFRSLNGGESWEEYSKGLTTDGQADLPNFRRPHFSDLSMSPSYSEDRTIFLAGFDGLFKSTDGGRIWQELDTLSANIIVGLDVSPNYQNDSTVAITTYLEGAYISHDRGDSWTDINQGLYKDKGFKRIAKKILQEGNIARSFEIEFSPNYTEDKTIFSPAWTDFLKSTNRGQQWQRIPLAKKPGFLNRPTKYSIAISPNFATDKTIFLGSMLGNGEDFLLESTDGGQSFSKIGSINGRAVVYLAISPNFATDKTLYAGIKDGVYKTVDRGKTWQPSGSGIPAMPEESRLAISPDYQADRTVFAGTAAGLFVTRDGGTSWSKLLTGMTDVEDGYVEAIAISPDYQSDRTAIVGFRGKGLFKSVDGGMTFTRVGNNLLAGNHSLANMYGFWPPTTAIKFSPAYARDRTIYGVAETNLFKSTDSGNTWTNLPLPKSQKTGLTQRITYYYHRLSVAPLTKFLVAALVALASYLALGRLRLDKKLSVRKILITTSGAFTAFLVAFFLFSF